ncbi:MAG: hypothetical protein PHF70_02060 [Opitutales bacterium]|nr:hypothetical protein [Opitutales bacterium]
MKPDSQLLAALRSKHLIFTVTSGRSGSHFLARVMGYVPRMTVFHEEKEHSFHHYLRAAQSDREVAERFLLEEKLPFIAACKDPVYFEASHLFCKGFFEPMHAWGLTPDLVILTRNIREISASLFQLGTIPGRTEKALTFYLSPEDTTVHPVPGWTSWSDYQLCYWYCLEIQRRAADYEKMALAAGAKVVRIDLSELKQWSCYKAMLRGLGLPLPGLLDRLRFIKNADRKAGDFSAAKQTIPLPEDRESQEAEVWRAFEGLDMGIRNTKQ